MPPSTSGLESTVTLTFKKAGTATLMTLVRPDLPGTRGGKGHQQGWNYFLDKLTGQFARKLTTTAPSI